MKNESYGRIGHARYDAAEESGKSIEEVKQDTDRDHFMSASEAKDWGLVDRVM